MASLFITGVSGFVGNNMVDYFHQRGVMIYGHSRKLQAVRKDVKIIDTISAEKLNENKITDFIHLAGIAHDLSNLYKPEDYYQVNLEGTKKAVEAFLQSRASRFIFVSSIKAACDTASIQVDEYVDPSPKTDYGKSKRMAEEYILSLSWPSDKQFYILRPCMMHGPGNKGNLNLLYRFAKSGLPFPFGSFHNKRAFHSIENFNFIIDKILSGKIPSGIYHLSDEGYLSTSQLYALICEALNLKPRIWNLNPKWMTRVFKAIGKQQVIAKLTEDMMVSNEKICRAMDEPLPVSLKEGLIKTVKSFHG
jgi:nucleoside-diphosphate-sugar epimerase